MLLLSIFPKKIREPYTGRRNFAIFALCSTPRKGLSEREAGIRKLFQWALIFRTFLAMNAVLSLGRTATLGALTQVRIAQVTLQRLRHVNTSQGYISYVNCELSLYLSRRISPKNENFISRSVRGAESNGKGPRCVPEGVLDTCT